MMRDSPYASGPSEHQIQTARRILYNDVLSDLRSIMINRMEKPEEVIVIINESNEPVREQIKDTESLATYKTMRETLGKICENVTHKHQLHFQCA